MGTPRMTAQLWKRTVDGGQLGGRAVTVLDIVAASFPLELLIGIEAGCDDEDRVPTG